jgi:hypothetical protein
VKRRGRVGETRAAAKDDDELTAFENGKYVKELRLPRTSGAIIRKNLLYLPANIKMILYAAGY